MHWHIYYFLDDLLKQKFVMLVAKCYLLFSIKNIYTFFFFNLLAISVYFKAGKEFCAAKIMILLQY